MELNMPRSGVGFATRSTPGKSRRSNSAQTARSPVAQTAAQIAAVCATGDRAVCAELDRLDFPGVDRVANPTPERGMFSSIQCAARWSGWNAQLTHWAIVLGDQPHLRRETLRALLDFAGALSNQVCQPSRLGRPRHPVVVPKTVFV